MPPSSVPRPPIGDVFVVMILMTATAAAAVSLGSAGFVAHALVESSGGGETLYAVSVVTALAAPFFSIWGMGHYWTRLAGSSAEAAKIGRAASAVVALSWGFGLITAAATADLAVGSSYNETSSGFVFFLILAALGTLAGASGFVARRLERPLPVGRVLRHCLLYGSLPLLGMAALWWTSQR